MTLLEDVSDTFTSFENETKDKTDWKAKYNELDSSWRKKYRDRFMNGPADEDDGFSEEEERKVPRRYEDLFTTI